MLLKRLLLIAFLMVTPFVFVWGQTEQLTLDDCIQQALEHNQSLSLSKLQKETSISQANSAQAIILPSVDLSLSGNYAGAFTPETITGIDSIVTTARTVYYPSTQLTGNYGDMSWADRYSLSLSVSQNVYDGGRWWNTLKAASVSTDLAEVTFDQSRVNTVYLVKQAFYAYLGTARLREVYSEILKSAQYQHDLALERFKVGAASLNDTLRTRVGVERARLQIINSNKDLSARAKELNLILARPYDTPVALAEATWAAVKIPGYDEAWALAQSQSPEIRQLERNRELSDYNLKIAKSDYIPSVGLSVGYANSANSPGDIVAKDNTSLSAGVRLNWNLFNGYRTKRNVEQRHIATRSADENLKYTVDQLKKDIAQTLLEMKDLQESLRISRIILDAAAQDYRLIQEQYRVGSASILDVIKITADYEDAKAGVIQAQYSLKLAEAKLDRFLGKQN